jgi:tetratricopeptide (TPR) repeat protein
LTRRAKKELSEKNTEKAIEHLEKAIQDSPQFTSALNRLGTIYFHAADYEKAEYYFDRALNSDPTAYAPLVNLCAAHFALKKIEKSLECNLRAVKRDPNDPLAHSQLGQSYFALGQFDAAIGPLNTSRKLDPAHFSYPQLILAEIYRLKGDDENLIKEVKEFLRLHPDVSFAPQLEKMISGGSKPPD